MRRPTIRVVVPAVLLAILATGCGSSSASSSAVVATGGIACSDLSGSVTFSPPLTTDGTAAETVSIGLTARGCTTHGSNVSRVEEGQIRSSLTISSSACAGLLNPQPIAVDVTWSPSGIHPSAVKVSGYSIGVSASGGGGFTLPNKGGTSQVNGSFAGTDHGSSSSSAIYSAEPVGQLVTSCGSAGGLASIAVTSGHLVLQ